MEHCTQFASLTRAEVPLLAAPMTLENHAVRNAFGVVPGSVIETVIEAATDGRIKTENILDHIGAYGYFDYRGGKLGCWRGAIGPLAAATTIGPGTLLDYAHRLEDLDLIRLEKASHTETVVHTLRCPGRPDSAAPAGRRGTLPNALMRTTGDMAVWGLYIGLDCDATDGVTQSSTTALGERFGCDRKLIERRLRDLVGLAGTEGQPFVRVTGKRNGQRIQICAGLRDAPGAGPSAHEPAAAIGVPAAALAAVADEIADCGIALDGRARVELRDFAAGGEAELALLAAWVTADRGHTAWSYLTRVAETLRRDPDERARCERRRRDAMAYPTKALSPAAAALDEQLAQTGIDLRRSERAELQAIVDADDGALLEEAIGDAARRNAGSWEYVMECFRTRTAKRERRTAPRTRDEPPGDAPNGDALMQRHRAKVLHLIGGVPGDTPGAEPEPDVAGRPAEARP